MPQVSETIPSILQPRVDAAVTWFNASADAAGEEFEVTGILDADDTLSGSDEVRLILCGGDRCEQRSFRVTSNGGGYEVSFLEDEPAASADGQTPAELDPPPGALRGWLDRTLGQHAFVVLLFYRGYW